MSTSISDRIIDENTATESSGIPIHIQAIGWIALSGTLYGFMSFFGIQILNDHLTVTSMLFWRFLIASIWMIGWSTLREPQFLKHFPSLRVCLKPLLLGAICYGGGSSIYFLASLHIGSGLAMVIFFSYPMFIAIFSFIKNRGRIHFITVASLMAIMGGLVLLKQNEVHVISLLGILLAIISAFFYAVYVFKCNRVMSGMNSNHFTILICLSCAALFLTIDLVTHQFAWPDSIKIWGYSFALGIIATAIPIQLLLEGLKHVSPLKASILSALEPVVTVIVGILLLHELISPLQIVGIIIILLGAILIQFTRE